MTYGLQDQSSTTELSSSYEQGKKGRVVELITALAMCEINRN